MDATEATLSRCVTWTLPAGSEGASHEIQTAPLTSLLRLVKMITMQLARLFLLVGVLAAATEAARWSSVEKSINSGTAFAVADPRVEGCVVLDDKSRMTFVPGGTTGGRGSSHGPLIPLRILLPSYSCLPLAEGSIAWGAYVDSLKTKSNFGKLRVVTNGTWGDTAQMRAAGFIEGYLSAGEGGGVHWHPPDTQ